MGIWKWLSRRRRDAELDEEIEAHLRMAVEDRMERGEDRERAEFAARRELGNEGLIKETTRGMWGWALRDQLAQDVRYAARMMRKNPGFAAVVVLTLALGIGANTAIYSVIRSALEPIAIPSPDRAVMVWTENPRREWQQFPSSFADYLDWKAGDTFATLAAFSEAGVNLRLADRTERVEGLDVSANFFDVFSLPPQLGRTIQPQDEQPGRPLVAVISDELWHSRFGGDPRIAGAGIVIDGVPYTIAGVLPSNFPTISHEKIYRPLTLAAGMADDRGHRFLYVAGRVRSGLNLPAAQQAMEAINVQLEARYPATNTGNRVRLQPLTEAYVQDAQTLSLVLAGAVGFVLLIACANIANLLLARGTTRGREMTIRAALGAGRGKLARQLLTESVFLAMIGGFLAILPALWGIRLATSLHIDELPNTDQVAMDWKVLAFTLALSLLTGIACGLAPAWQVAKVHVSDALKAAGRRPEGRFHQRIRGMFVVSEIALTLVLLAGAGLLLRSFIQLRTANPGYDPHGVLTLRVALSERQYADPARQAAFFDAAIQRLRALPGVVAAAGTRELPTSDDIHGTGLHFPDRPEPRTDEIPIVLLDSVTPDYFRVMRVPLLRGRYLTDSDRRGGPLTAVVDEWTAQRSWPGQDAIGRQIRFGSGEPLREVVGVVGNVEASVVMTLVKGRMGQVYVPFAQEPKPATSLVLRTHGDPGQLASSVREAMRSLDPDQPVFRIQTMEAARMSGRSPLRLATWLVGCFAIVGLALAAIGIYGVTAFHVGRRSREFGIRMSLGAQPRDVRKQVLGQAAAVTAMGIALGVAGALGLTQVLSSLLYGIHAGDPVTFVGATTFLAVLSVAAAWIPARRATRIDPVQALREE